MEGLKKRTISEQNNPGEIAYVVYHQLSPDFLVMIDEHTSKIIKDDIKHGISIMLAAILEGDTDYVIRVLIPLD